LPAANPPATTILSGLTTRVERDAGPAVVSESLEVMEKPFERI
jgi:hypothetical protein